MSALIKDGATRNILTNFKMNFVFPEYGLEEIYFYKSVVIKKSKISEREFDVLLLRLLKYIRLVPLEMIVKFRREADEIMGGVDKKDVPFIATALFFSCPIWSDDKHFQKQKEVKVFTTNEIMRFLKK